MPYLITNYVVHVIVYNLINLLCFRKNKYLESNPSLTLKNYIVNKQKNISIFRILKYFLNYLIKIEKINEVTHKVINMSKYLYLHFL